MVDFAGWRLPVQFSGLLDEHEAVRQRVGLFDVSHMGEAGVRGKGSLDFLQHVTCNDVSRLKPGRAQYTALTTPQGTFVDDLLLYMLDENDYLLVINAGNTPKDLDCLRSQSAAFDVEVEDASDEWAQLALQGPRAVEVLQPLVSPTLSGLRSFRFLRTEVAGVPCIASRTGYTGEDGFELYAPAAEAPGLWSALTESGAPHGLAPVGLGARDTLRLEAKLALYGNDIDETTTVIEADLAWIVKPGKGPFVGREVLVRQLEQGAERRLVGFELRDRAIARHGFAALHESRPVGRVTSGTHSPTLKKSIGLVYLPTGLSETGTEFEIEIRGRRVPAVVVSTPFYRRPSPAA
jgi:aminomethyltransferase